MWTLLLLAAAPASAKDDAQLHGTITPPGADTRHATTEVAAYDDLVQGYPTLTEDDLRTRLLQDCASSARSPSRSGPTRRAPA